MNYTYHPTIHEIGIEQWKSFSIEWEHQLTIARQAIKMLRQRESKLQRADIQFLTADEANANHIEWLGLIPKLTHPIDKVFFQPWWYHIEKDSFGLYIDLSNPNLPLCTNEYKSFGNHSWYTQVVFNSVSELLIKLDLSNNIQKIMWERKMAMVNKVYGNRIFEGSEDVELFLIDKRLLLINLNFHPEMNRPDNDRNPIANYCS